MSDAGDRTHMLSRGHVLENADSVGIDLRLEGTDELFVLIHLHDKLVAGHRRSIGGAVHDLDRQRSASGCLCLCAGDRAGDKEHRQNRCYAARIVVMP